MMPFIKESEKIAEDRKGKYFSVLFIRWPTGLEKEKPARVSVSFRMKRIEKKKK